MHGYVMEERGWIARHGFWPLALGGRRLWRWGCRLGAWLTGIGLGAVTMAASVVAGRLRPVAIAVFAVVRSLPVWGAWWWLVRRG